LENRVPKCQIVAYSRILSEKKPIRPKNQAMGHVNIGLDRPIRSVNPACIFWYDLTAMEQKRIRYGILLSAMFLAGCSSGATSCSDTVQVKEFSMCLLSDWEQVPEEVLRAENVPEETLAAFQLKVDRGGQRDNIVISRERVKSGVAPLKYAETNMTIVEKAPEYMLTEKRELTIDGEDTILHIFSGRPVSDLPARRFYQVSFVKATTGYVVTGTLPYSVDEEIEQGLITMLSSVSFKGEEK